MGAVPVSQAWFGNTSYRYSSELEQDFHHIKQANGEPILLKFSRGL